MKPSFLALLIVTFFLNAQATTAGEKASPKLLQKTTSKQIYSTTPFDMTIERLPKNYKGHNILDIYQKLTPPRSKGEFEKTEEYEGRIARWKESTILGKITTKDNLAFEISEFLAPDTLTAEYDADKELLTVMLLFENQYFPNKARWLEIFYRSKNLGSHTGITRMGVKFRVTSHIGTSVGLAVKEQIQTISITKPYSRDEARSIKNTIRAYAIATLEEPYKVDASTSTTASLDDPDEWLKQHFGLYVSLKAIWFVNTKTGEVFAKSEPPFVECRYGIC